MPVYENLHAPQCCCGAMLFMPAAYPALQAAIRLINFSLLEKYYTIALKILTSAHLRKPDTLYNSEEKYLQFTT